MKRLPFAARLYVGTVMAAAAVVAAVCLPLSHIDRQPLLFISLVTLASMTAAFKVMLPITTAGSTMSVSYAVAFASLLLLGPHATTVVAGAGAVSQCLLNRKEDNPLHRTLFSVASLVLTVEGAGLALRLLDSLQLPSADLTAVGRVVAGATTYFLLNTWLVATAVALSTE